MGFNSYTFQKANEILADRRMNAEKTAEQRQEIIFSRVPRLKELDKEISSTNIRIARIVVRGGDVVSEMTKLKEKNIAYQKEFAELLKANGYSENVLEPRYCCSKCSDKGQYEENGRSMMCSCMKNLLVSVACEELNKTAPLSLSTFETFNIDYYSKDKDENTGISPYYVMSKVYEFCIKYAKKFNEHSGSILMKGNTGLGKTHLSLAIANEVIKKGCGVIYVSAPLLLQRLEKNYFSGDKSDDIEQFVTDCDLLIIDDLGTEFKTPFSTSQLYNVCNSRILKNKPIIISTNLSPEEMKNDYSERFVSRIFGGAQTLDFLGEDIRILKKI